MFKGGEDPCYPPSCGPGCQCWEKESSMLKFFVFISLRKTTHIASFVFSDSCFSAAQMAKISLLAVAVASLDIHLFYKCSRSFVHHAVQIWGSITRRRSEAVHMTVYRYQTHTFRFQFLRQKNVSAYNIAAVCCSSHVQENMLSSNRFTAIQGKIMSWLSKI